MNHGKLALRHCGLQLPLQVLKSPAGYYIGTADQNGPVSRESEQYWSDRKVAEAALGRGAWTQRLEP